MPFTIAGAMPRRKYGTTSFGERLTAYETEAGFPPTPAIIDLANALAVHDRRTAGSKGASSDRLDDDPEARRMWKRFQMVWALPERDQKAVIRLINSLVAAGAPRRNATPGEQHGR